MAWIDKFVGPGEHGIWVLPERKLFYPYVFGPSGYLVERPEQERSIRTRYRWLAAALWLPSVIAVATDDWRWVLGYTIGAVIAQYVVVRVMTRGMPRVRESLWLFRSWRIRAHHYPRSFIALGVLANVCLVALCAWGTTLGGSVWGGIALMAFFFFWVLRWAFVWFVKAT